MTGAEWFVFQSAPVIADGRSQLLASGTFTFVCFNPRPSSLTGDLHDQRVGQQVAVVSIRARHR